MGLESESSPEKFPKEFFFDEESGRWRRAESSMLLASKIKIPFRRMGFFVCFFHLLFLVFLYNARGYLALWQIGYAEACKAL